MKVSCGCIFGVGGKSCRDFWKYRRSILKVSSKLDIVCHNYIGKNDAIHDQNLKKHSYKKSKTEYWSCNKNEISTPTSSEVWLFWCETRMLSPTENRCFPDLNKKYGTAKCRHMSWYVSTKQIHNRSSHLTLSGNKNQNFQSTEKIILKLFKIN